MRDWVLALIGVSLSDEQLQALESYAALVRHWNAVAGLVSGADLKRFFERHLLDSLLLVPRIRERESPGRKVDGVAEDEVPSVLEIARESRPIGEPLPIADFGSGAGLPGIPLAIALPETRFILVDRSEKKTRFLRRVRDELTLRNLRVRRADVGELPPASCTAVVARAAMPIARLWPLAQATFAARGYLLVLDKIVQSQSTPDADLPSGCEGGSVQRHWVRMPDSNTWHGVLEFEEINP